MQVETTITTTETQTVGNMNFQIKTFEQTISAFCDCCPNQANGTKPELEKRGWELNANSQFCPNCNY